MDLNEGNPALPIPVRLHPADHQVAGHRFDGRLGSSVDESGRFYKPLQDGDRGNREIDFYHRLQVDTGVPSHIRAYFPKYFGTTVAIEAPSGGGGTIRHGIMEDLTHGFHHPSIIDLKIGFRTWYPEASDHTIEKNILKDAQTTSGVLGFRVSGMQVYEASHGTTFRVDRDWARNLSVDDVTVALKRYVSSNPQNETDPDAAFASRVYGGTNGIIAQLQVLEDWFSTQTNYHFASSSLLFIYDAADHVSSASSHENRKPLDESGTSNSVTVKLVDFAHTISGNNNSLDKNFLDGLKSVISLLSSIVESHAAM